MKMTTLNAYLYVASIAYCKKYEPRCEKKNVLGFLTWSNTNRAVQLQKMDRASKFRIKKVGGLHYLSNENKGADYREADLRLCFRISDMQKAGFLMTRLIYQSHNWRNMKKVLSRQC